MRKIRRSKRPVVSDYSKVRRKSALILDAKILKSPIPKRSIKLRWEPIVLKPQLVARKPRIRKDPLAHTRMIEPVRRIHSCNYRKDMMRKLAAQVKASGGSLARWRKTLSNKSSNDCRSK
jgi:hypothetical protein